MTSHVRSEFSITSSTADDVWHPNGNKQAYEWWYFDALSDDGREAVVIIFFDSFLFSPRYNRFCSESRNDFPSETSETSKTKFPAFAFFYYRDGKAVYRCINEFTPEEFSASTTEAKCRVGDSEFHIGVAPYGPGYGVTVNGVMTGGQKLSANFEWVSVESDLNLGDGTSAEGSLHNWNLAVPRADVSGKISVEDEGGNNVDVINFRGTGYHDHNHDTRWMPDAVSAWQWGRIHCCDGTVVYYDYVAKTGERITRLVSTVGGKAECVEAKIVERSFRFDVFGLRYPSSLTFEGSNGLRLTVFNSRPIDSSFFYLRHINDAVLTMPDGSEHKGAALCERLVPRALRWRFLDRMIDMRIGRDGKGAFIK